MTAIRQLWLIRHAEAIGQAPSQRDFDRYLSEKGLEEVKKLSQQLQAFGLKPDVWLASTAIRTQMTARLLADSLSFDAAQIENQADLYDAAEADVLFYLKNLPNTANTAILVGHNPSLMSVASQLANDYVPLPTCGAICFEVWGDWAQLGTATAKLQPFNLNQ